MTDCNLPRVFPANAKPCVFKPLSTIDDSILNLPTAKGTLSLKWDSKKFEGLITESENSGVILYAGKEIATSNPDLASKIIAQRMTIEKESKARKRELESFDFIGRLGIGADIDHYGNRTRALHLVNWEFTPADDTGDFSNWLLEIRVAGHSVTGSGRHYHRYVWEFDTIQLSECDVTRMTRREIEYAIYDTVMAKINELPVVSVSEYERGFLDQLSELDTGSVKVGGVLRRIKEFDAGKESNLNAQCNTFFDDSKDKNTLAVFDPQTALTKADGASVQTKAQIVKTMSFKAALRQDYVMLGTLFEGCRFIDIRPEGCEVTGTSYYFPMPVRYLTKRTILSEHSLKIELDFFEAFDAYDRRMTEQEMRNAAKERRATIKAKAKIEAARIKAEADTENAELLATAMTNRDRK